MDSKTIVIANQKGGVGKTTTAVTMASILKNKGLKILLVDADPQGNSTDTYGAQVKKVATLYDVLMSEDENDIYEAIQRKDISDIIPSDPLLIKAEKILSSDSMNGIYCLKEKLALIQAKEHYDFIIIDTNPTITTLLINALVASDEVIIPLTPGRYATQGLDELQKTFADVKKRHNQKLDIVGMLLVKYDKRKRLDKKINQGLNELSDQLAAPLFATTIRSCQKVEESQAYRMPLMEFAGNCTTAIDYIEFVEEYLKIQEDNHGKI